VTEPITKECDPRDPTIQSELINYKSQNWDIFIVPETLINEYKNLGLLNEGDNVSNLCISLSFGGLNKSDFFNAVHQQDRHSFFKITEQQGINHTLYRIINSELKLVCHLQESLPDLKVRFTGCYIDKYFEFGLYGLTTNAYPQNILSKISLGYDDEIPNQEIVLVKLNPTTKFYEDVMVNQRIVKLIDLGHYYHDVHFEWRDPCVTDICDNIIEFVFCARLKDNSPCIGQGQINIETMDFVTLPPIILPCIHNCIYLECPQVFKDKKGHNWLISSVGLANGIHYQGCWIHKDGKWETANADGLLITGFPTGYQTYSGKLTQIDDKVFYNAWIANQAGTPNSILKPTEMILDHKTMQCRLKPFESQSQIEIKIDQLESNESEEYMSQKLDTIMI
jgi:hypothetical protein